MADLCINSGSALVYITSSKTAKCVCVSVCVTKGWIYNFNVPPQRQRQTIESEFKARLVYISIPGQPELHNETQSQNKRL